jgi:hypothetical protein
MYDMINIYIYIYDILIYITSISCLYGGFHRTKQLGQFSRPVAVLAAEVAGGSRNSRGAAGPSDFFFGVIFLGGNPCVYIIYPLVI